MNFDYNQFLSSVATVAGTVGLVYTILRNFRQDMKDEMSQMRHEFHDRIDRQENRIFQLAMGKSLKEILLEERNKIDPEQYAKEMTEQFATAVKKADKKK